MLEQFWQWDQQVPILHGYVSRLQEELWIYDGCLEREIRGVSIPTRSIICKDIDEVWTLIDLSNKVAGGSAASFRCFLCSSFSCYQNMISHIFELHLKNTYDWMNGRPSSFSICSGLVDRLLWCLLGLQLIFICEFWLIWSCLPACLFKDNPEKELYINWLLFLHDKLKLIFMEFLTSKCNNQNVS